MRYAPPRSAPGVRRATQRDPLTSVPTYASATTGRVCAPEHHPRTTRRGWGVSVVSVGGTVWLYDELAVKLLRCGPSFSSLRSKGSTHACTRITLGPPLHMTALLNRPFWTNTRQRVRAVKTSFFSWPRLRAAPASTAIRQADLRFMLLLHRKRYGCICTYVNVNNNDNPRSWFPSSLCPMSDPKKPWHALLCAHDLQ
jgi:hypothetical protein